MPASPSLCNYRDPAPPPHYLIAYTDGGARGNPGPAGYGVVVQDESSKKIAELSQYLGHQTNNFAEYQGLIAALEYALEHGYKALKVISDSELLVRQIKGIYKVKSPILRDLHARSKQLVAQLDWFSIGHALREHNRDADRLANEAMDKGTNRVGRAIPPASSGQTLHETSDQELQGVVRNGVIELSNGKLPEGTRVGVRVRK
jgi:ribonuclease HI